MGGAAFPNYGGGNENNGDLPQKIPWMYCYTQCPQSCSRPPPTHVFAEDSRTPADMSSMGFTVPSSLVLVHKVLLCHPRVYFPALCKFWQLYGGVNGDLLQDNLLHTQVCCIQSPCPCCRPLPTCTFIGDTQTQFCFSLCGIPGSWCAQVCLSPLSVSGGNGVWLSKPSWLLEVGCFWWLYAKLKHIDALLCLQCF